MRVVVKKLMILIKELERIIIEQSQIKFIVPSEKLQKIDSITQPVQTKYYDSTSRLQTKCLKFYAMGLALRVKIEIKMTVRQRGDK